MASKKAINKYQKRLGRNEPLAPPSNVPQQTLALQPHEIAFAEWLVTCPKRPKIAEQMAVLSEMAAETGWTGVVTKNYLHNLKNQRQQFQEFSAELMRDHLSAARAKYKVRVDWAVDVRSV